MLACGGELLPEGDLSTMRPAAAPPRVPIAPPDVHAAIGPLSDCTDQELSLYVDPAAFARLGAPKKNWWRDRVPERGQTFPDFVVSAPNWPRAPRRRLYLLPLGVFPNEMVVTADLVVLVRAPELTLLADYLQRFFGLPVTVLDAQRLEELDVPVRATRGQDQIDASGLLARIADQLPADAYSMTALINRDMFLFEEQEYAFGYGLHRDRLAVMSFARFDPIFVGRARPERWREDIDRRSLAVLTHEVAHTFGMRHCSYYACVLNGVSHPREIDATPLHLCPVCLRKLLAFGVDPAARYESLKEFYDANDLPDDAAWVRRRLRRMGATMSARR